MKCIASHVQHAHLDSGFESVMKMSHAFSRPTLVFPSPRLSPLGRGRTVVKPAAYAARLEFSRVAANDSLSLSRNDTVENGERDRPSRCHRRPADGFCGAHTQPNGDNSTTLDWSARRRPERARRTRSPFLIESFRLRVRGKRAPARTGD